MAHHTDINSTLAELKARVAAFVHERDWQQFHDPKSLSMALALEAAELMELFTWAADRNQAYTIATEKREQVEHELVDVLHVVLAFANACNIDITSALLKKMELNMRRYPIEQSRGKAVKHTELKAEHADD